MRGLKIACSAALALSCSETVLPPNLGGTPFGEAIDLDQAEDLGYAAAPLPAAEQRPAGAITLRDVTSEVGLQGAVSGGNQHGVGIAFVDLTGDGFADIFVANGVSNTARMQTAPALYVNDGAGGFVEETAQRGISAIAQRDLFSVAAGDYDQDGDVDLYLGSRPQDILLRNDGGVFVDATAEAGAGGPPSETALFSDGRGKVVAFGDYDQDGWLDVVSASSTIPRPGVYLLRNRQDGTFEDVSEATSVMAHRSGNPCAVLWTDHDNDADLDLWIWNDRGGHILLRNDGGVFSDQTESSALDEVGITHPMGIDAADIDHDGDLDVYISNIGNNPLLRNNSDGTFSDITKRAGTEGDYGWGLSFEDFNGDTWPDLFVAQEDNRPHLLFAHQGLLPPTFERIEVEHPEVLDRQAAHNTAAAFADYDHDGRVDVVVAETDGSRITLYRNETEVGSHRYLHVTLGPSGGATARVGIKSGPLIQFQEIYGGSSRASQNEHTARFGLGNYSGADWVAVLWSTGAQRVFTNVEGNQRLVVTP